jgi:hypothetical protein
MPFIYSMGDRFAKISDDKIIAVIDPEIKMGELYPEMREFLKEMSDENAPFVEVLTTPRMLRRILREFTGEDGVIRFGISSKQSNGASLMRISNDSGRVVIVAGRSDE